MKILILSASPHRDLVIDGLIKEELVNLGHEVLVKPCLREGRTAILEYMPDIVVVPPIRNPYSRDFVETCKDWGLGVVSRHTEASCDWFDYKNLKENARHDILGRWQYVIDKELVWGEDEAEILNRRGAKHKAIAIGAFGLDIYKQPDFRKKFISKEDFYKKWNFDLSKKIFTISSPWGFCDSAPDLSIDEMILVQREEEGRSKYLALIESLKNKLSTMNILVTLHPGVLVEPYKVFLSKIGIALDTESTATDILVNTDVLLHAGSTMSMEMHCMDKPAFQFGDVNEKYSCGWWIKTGTALSRISPRFTDVDELVTAILTADKSNANLEAIKELETGRYGKMDGLAYKRAAKEISEVTGKFQYCWPRSHYDYDTINVFKDEQKAFRRATCGICKKEFIAVGPDWARQFCMIVKGDMATLDKIWKNNTCCPNCAARFIAQ